MRCERDHTANDKILSRRQIATEQLQYHVIHGLRMKNLPCEREQQHDKREKRQNSVCCDAECKRMHLGLHEISGKGRQVILLRAALEDDIQSLSPRRSR